MRRQWIIWAVLGGLFLLPEVRACSVLYYIDKHSGKIYVVNNEDYWYDVNAYIRILPGSGNKLARFWYGWDDFAQGGINSAGLFFDGAVTPEQLIPDAYRGPKGNLGDEILAKCSTVSEAVQLLEEKKIALSNAHMMIGDRHGNAVVMEWLDGQRRVIPVTDNRLIMTNFLLSDTARGNHPCWRYNSIETRLQLFEESGEEASLKSIGNTLGGAVQVPFADESGRVGGTLYTTFINISDMELVLVYKLDNSKVMRFSLSEEFENGKRKIKLE